MNKNKMNKSNCAVRGCSVRAGDGISLHTFTIANSDIWKQILGITTKMMYSTDRVCRLHFSPECFEGASKRLKSGSNPSLNLGLRAEFGSIDYQAKQKKLCPGPDIDMSVDVDDSILANIKQDSDDEDDETAGETFMEEVLGDVAVERERTDDPLDGNEDEEERKEFQWHCEGNDFLKPYSCDEEQEMLEVKMGGSKSKIARTELAGLNGQVWSKVPLTPPMADDLPGMISVGKGPAKSVANPLESWHLLFDVPMLNQVVKNTNEFIKAAKKKESHQKRLTDMTEMRAWLGLNYLCGVLRNSSFPGPTEELWTLELGNAIFRATMTYKRFEYLSECVRSVDQHSIKSPLDEIASIWEKLVINCRSYYAPSDFCMIDEHVLDLSIDSRSPFDHTLPTQPGSKGLRLITMCDAKTLYLSNAIVASHHEPMDEEVYQLVSDIKGTPRRCLGLNERFSTMGLMQKLKQCQLQVVGALPQTAKEIPPELYSGSIVPQVWYTENDTTLISGLDESVTPTRFLLTNGLSTRINAVKLFQNIKDCNIKAYEQVTRFSTRHAHAQTNNLPWYLDFFYFMLDVSAFNSWIIYRLSEKGDAAIEQRDFQRQLGLYLTQQQLKQRLHMNIKLPLPLKLQIAEILGENVESMLNGASSRASDAAKLGGSIPAEKALIPEGIVLQPRENENRRRCRGCKSRNGSKIKTRCQQCLMPFCMRHLISRCEGCSGYEFQQLDPNKSEEQLTTDIDVSLE